MVTTTLHLALFLLSTKSHNLYQTLCYLMPHFISQQVPYCICRLNGAVQVVYSGCLLLLEMVHVTCMTTFKKSLVPALKKNTNCWYHQIKLKTCHSKDHSNTRLL